MALDRQYLVEILDAQGQQVGILSASNINVVDSKVTGTTPGTATSIATYAGNGQSGTVGANIAIPPAVRVTDTNGLPVAGSSVTWFHGGGSGTTSTGTITTTNSNGIAQVGTWSLGTTAGSTYTLFAYSGNLTNSPIRFSCTPTAGSAFSISASRGTSQTSTPLGTMPSSLSACVHDQYGNPVNGTSVTVTTTDTTATIGTAALTTSSSGHAGTTYVAGEIASVASVLFAISSTTSARFAMTTVAGEPTAPSILEGDNQIAEVSQILPLPVTVLVDDTFGNVISSGETLQFVVVQGSGSVSRATATPGTSGSSFTWAMGASAGQNAVEISLENRSNSTVTVFASGTNPLADTIFPVAGIGQSATVGAALGAPIRWGVTGSGASAAGQVVNLTVTGDAALSAAQTTSTSTGLVNVTVTAGTVASIYTVTATAAGLTGSPSEISFAAVAGSATSLVVQTQPTSNPVPGVAWPQQPIIVSTDVYGNLVSTNTRVGAVLTSGDGTLASAVSMFAVASGATATFSGLSYTQVTSNAFQVVYRCNSLSTATGDQQTAQPPFASQLGFTVQPTGGSAGGGIGSVSVAVQDSTGATVPSATDPVTISLGNNPGSATLGGTTTVAASSGVATFTNLTVSAAGDGYTLLADATGLPQETSAAFNMTAAATSNRPAGMTTWTSGDLTTETVDTQFADQSTHQSWKWYTYTPNKIVVRSLAQQASWRNAAVSAFPSPPNGADLVLSNEITPNGSNIIAWGEKGKGEKTAPSGTKSIYIDMYCLASSNWKGEPRMKRWYFKNSTEGPVILMIYASGAGALSVRVHYQGSPGGPTISAFAWTRNVWARIELVCVAASTAGGSDGHFTVFKDGVKVHQKTDMTTAQVTWTTQQWLAYFGGGQNTSGTETQYFLTADGWTFATSTSRVAAP